MNQLNVYSGGILIAKLLSSAIPSEGHVLSFNERDYNVKQVKLIFEKTGNAFVLEEINVSVWLVP